MKTLQELYNFYNNIPDNMWTKKSIKKSGRYCAIGHFVRFVWDKEAHKLIETIGIKTIVDTNDTEHGSPKENVLKLIMDKISGH